MKCKIAKCSQLTTTSNDHAQHKMRCSRITTTTTTAIPKYQSAKPKQCQLLPRDQWWPEQQRRRPPLEQMEKAQCTMHNAKCKMQNAKCQMPNAKCQMPNAKCKTKNKKHKMQNAQCKFQKAPIYIHTTHTCSAACRCVFLTAARSSSRSFFNFAWVVASWRCISR